MYQMLEDGGIRLTYEDYNVEAFGGGDYEAIYTLSKKDTDKLYEILNDEYMKNDGRDNLDLKELIHYFFGERLEKRSFASYCNKNDIKYNLQTFVH